MAYTRRALLQAAATGCGAAVIGGTPGSVAAGPAGDPVGFSGSGVYLYPHWGEARPYLVMQSSVANLTLEFHDPATRRLLWTQTQSLTGGFAGKLM